jgi:hypothetical protein
MVVGAQVVPFPFSPRRRRQTLAIARIDAVALTIEGVIISLGEVLPADVHSSPPEVADRIVLLRSRVEVLASRLRRL